MKTLPTLTLLLIAVSASAQISGFKRTKSTTATIDQYLINIGDTLQLGVGSGVNGDFMFIGTFAGKGITGFATPTASAQYANSSVVVYYFAKIKGADQLIPVCKPTIGSQQVWLYPQLKNAILKKEIVWK